jgi:molecular chaperone HtpG
MSQLLNLIIHSLYTHKEIFLRELISNASDALSKMRLLALTEKGFLDEGKTLNIIIKVNEKKKTVTIVDNGIGMNRNEVIANIGTIANSGTLNFLKEMKKEQTKSTDLIGQFGVGFYSVFMVAEEVIIRTKSYKNEDGAVQWKSSGSGKYTLEEIDKKERGTEIICQLKKEEDEFASPYRIRNIIQKYSNFVDFPIIVEEEEKEKKDKDKDEKGPEQINTVSALWRRRPNEISAEERKEFYQFIANDFSEPLDYLHIQAEAPLSYSAMLFIPAAKSNSLFQRPDEFQMNLYVKRVFIQHDCKDLLPQYLRFVKGVVDTDDLPLNVSREVTQSSPVMAKIKKALVNRILKSFAEWAEKDKEKYAKFFSEFGNLLKEGVHFDFENKDRIVELLRFYSTRTKDKEMTSLKEYISRMKKEQKDIYFLVGESLESLRKSPNLEYFNKNDMEVLLLNENIDDFIMPIINQYDKKDLKSIEKADLDITDKKIISPDGPDGATRVAFLDKVKEILKDQVKDVTESKRLVESPCTLVTAADAMNTHMEKMMKMMDANFQASKKILELNLNNPIIQNLIKLFQANAHDVNLSEGIMALYDGALLQEGSLDDPSNLLKNLHRYMEKATGSRIITG